MSGGAAYGHTYTRTETFTDIHAEPGYRARTTRRYDPQPSPWYRVVGWRLYEQSPGWPIVAGSDGVYLLPRPYGDELLSLLLPGQEEPA